MGKKNNRNNFKKISVQLFIFSIFFLLSNNVVVADDLQKYRTRTKIIDSTLLKNEAQEFRDVIHRYDYRPKKISIHDLNSKTCQNYFVDLILQDIQRQYMIKFFEKILITQKMSVSDKFGHQNLTNNYLYKKFEIKKEFSLKLISLRGGKFELENIKNNISGKLQTTKNYISIQIINFLILQKQKSKMLLFKETLAILIIIICILKIYKNKKEIRDFFNYFLFSYEGRNEIIEKITNFLLYINDLIPESKAEKKRSLEIKKLYRDLNIRMRDLLKDLKESHGVDETLDNFSRYQNQRERFKYVKDLIDKKISNELQKKETIDVTDTSKTI